MRSSLTYNEVLSAYAEYPAPIRPFLLRAETHPVLRALLTKSFMRVMIDVVSRTPLKDPDRPILLRVDRVAVRLGISCKTVTRALAILKQHGWLRPAPGHDGRNHRGEFSTRQYVVADELREILGLSLERPVTDPKPLDEHQDEQSLEIEYPEETKMSHGLYMVNKVFEKEASFKKSLESKNSGTRLPADLQELNSDLGIHPFGVFKLMQIAKSVGQRLQDVWTVKREQILTSGAREGRAVRYLEFLLRCGEDFSYLARVKRTKHSAPRHTIRAQMSLSRKDYRNYWNMKFTGPNDLRVTIHGDGSAELSDYKRPYVYIRPADMGPVYEAIEKGILRVPEV